MQKSGQKLKALFSAQLVALSLMANTAADAAQDMSATVLKLDAIRVRIARTHAIHGDMVTPSGDDEPSVHVYLTMKDHAFPYVVSLGNFVVLTKGDDVKVLDEFGENIPAPLRPPERPGFHKGDMLGIKAFDLLTEGKYAAALKTNEAALKAAPNSYRLHNNQGVFLVLVNRHEEANKEFAEAIKINANCAAAYVNRAWHAVALGKPDASIADAQKALELEPKLAPASQCLVKAKLEGGNKEEAAASLKETGLENRKDKASLKLQAETLLANKDYQNARIVLNKVRLVAPDDVDVILQLAFVSDKLGNLDEALIRAQQAVQMRPDNPSVREIMGRYLEKNRDYTAAALQYESAIDVLNDTNPKDKMKRALAIEGPLLRSIMQLNDFKRAETWSHHFTKEFPTSASAHYNRGWLLSQSAEEYNIKEAIGEYDQAIKLDPKLNATHYNLALLAVKLKDNERAEAELKLFLELAPNDPDHKNAADMLEKLKAETGK